MGHAGTQVLLVSAMRQEEYEAQSPRRRVSGDLGIRYLAAWLRRHGTQADVLPAHRNSRSELARRLTEADDLLLVGFSLHTSSIESGLDSLSLCRSVRPDLPIVIGGYLPTFAADELVKAGVDFDYLLAGEAEWGLLDLVQRIRQQQSVASVQGAASINTIGLARALVSVRCQLPDLDELPVPLRTKDDMPADTREVMVSGSRGCYGNCAFCSVPEFARAGWRGRQPESIAQEIADLVHRFGVEFVDFVDDSLFGSHNRLERAGRLRDALASHAVKVRFRASIRPNDIDPEVTAILKDCGLSAVQLGVESFSGRQLRDVYRKGCTPADAVRAISVLHDAGIHVQIGLILFEPSTTLSDLRENAAVLTGERWAVTKSSTSMLYAAKGTRIADSLVAARKSLGIDNYLNHRWAFANPEVGYVHESLGALEARHHRIGEALVDAVTPSQSSADSSAATELRHLQNAYQRLSFRALAIACDEAKDGARTADIVHSLENNLSSEYDSLLSHPRVSELRESQGEGH